MRLALAIVLILSVYAAYNEKIADAAVGTVCWVYCDQSRFATDDCGACTRMNEENGLELLYYHSNNFPINIINMAIFK